jgi:hypothetical protein
MGIEKFGNVMDELGLFQIRRTIRKKHTLPNYKFRMKPFFTPPPPRVPQKDLFINGTKIGHGKLTVTIKCCSRLIDVPPDSILYCTLSVGMDSIFMYMYFKIQLNFGISNTI